MPVNKDKIEAAVDTVVGPMVAFKPTDISNKTGRTKGYTSHVPNPSTIRPPGFKQIGLFRIDPNKNKPKDGAMKVSFTAKK